MNIHDKERELNINNKTFKESQHISEENKQAIQKLIDMHPFNDGNKRTAIMITDRFLEENNREFKPAKS